MIKREKKIKISSPVDDEWTRKNPTILKILICWVYIEDEIVSTFSTPQLNWTPFELT